MKTAVSLPDELFEAADSLAKRLRMSRSELYASALEAYIRTHQSAEITAAFDRVYGEESSSLDPVVSALQRSSIPRDEW
jgi:metal-responsive CopG/Arc/MetJ family transcriptional regulator